MRRCPVCLKKSDQKKVSEAGKYKMFHCPSCDVVFADPFKAPGASWYENAEMYTVGRVITKTTEWYHKQVLGRKIKGKSLIDIGCGTGIFLSEAKKLGYDVYGIDFDRSNIKVAKEKYKIENVFCYSVAELKKKFGKHRFDIVTFFEVLEHLDSPKKFLDDIKDLLTPGGVIALSVPNRNRFIDTIGIGDAPPNHLTKWSAGALRNFIAEQGFVVIDLVEKPLNSDDIAHYLKGKIRFGLAHGMVKKGLETNNNESIKKAGLLMKVKNVFFNTISMPPGILCGLLRFKGSNLTCIAKLKA
ncbi:MAG: class I SAM-dependent methyltransferase [Deltaproteobacteria bacterium]|nr:class I SAM-dependent methyltransferase [Deltaproteobacteria bacterium]